MHEDDGSDPFDTPEEISLDGQWLADAEPWVLIRPAPAPRGVRGGMGVEISVGAGMGPDRAQELVRTAHACLLTGECGVGPDGALIERMAGSWDPA